MGETVSMTTSSVCVRRPSVAGCVDGHDGRRRVAPVRHLDPLGERARPPDVGHDADDDSPSTRHLVAAPATCRRSSPASDVDVAVRGGHRVAGLVLARVGDDVEGCRRRVVSACPAAASAPEASPIRTAGSAGRTTGGHDGRRSTGVRHDSPHGCAPLGPCRPRQLDGSTSSMVERPSGGRRGRVEGQCTRMDQSRSPGWPCGPGTSRSPRRPGDLEQLLGVRLSAARVGETGQHAGQLTDAARRRRAGARRWPSPRRRWTCCTTQWRSANAATCGQVGHHQHLAAAAELARVAARPRPRPHLRPRHPPRRRPRWRPDRRRPARPRAPASPARAHHRWPPSGQGQGASTRMRLEQEGHLVDPARAALHPTTVRQGEAGGIGVVDLALRHHDHELGVRHRQRTELGGDRTRKACRRSPCGRGRARPHGRRAGARSAAICSPRAATRVVGAVDIQDAAAGVLDPAQDVGELGPVLALQTGEGGPAFLHLGEPDGIGLDLGRVRVELADDVVQEVAELPDAPGELSEDDVVGADPFERPTRRSTDRSQPSARRWTAAAATDPAGGVSSTAWARALLLRAQRDVLARLGLDRGDLGEADVEALRLLHPLLAVAQEVVPLPSQAGQLGVVGGHRVAGGQQRPVTVEQVALTGRWPPGGPGRADRGSPPPRPRPRRGADRDRSTAEQRRGTGPPRGRSGPRSATRRPSHPPTSPTRSASSSEQATPAVTWAAAAPDRTRSATPAAPEQQTEAGHHHGLAGSRLTGQHRETGAQLQLGGVDDAEPGQAQVVITPGRSRPVASSASVARPGRRDPARSTVQPWTGRANLATSRSVNGRLLEPGQQHRLLAAPHRHTRPGGRSSAATSVGREHRGCAHRQQVDPDHRRRRDDQGPREERVSGQRHHQQGVDVRPHDRAHRPRTRRRSSRSASRRRHRRSPSGTAGRPSTSTPTSIIRARAAFSTAISFSAQCRSTDLAVDLDRRPRRRPAAPRRSRGRRSARPPGRGRAARPRRGSPTRPTLIPSSGVRAVRASSAPRRIVPSPPTTTHQLDRLVPGVHRARCRQRPARRPPGRVRPPRCPPAAARRRAGARCRSARLAPGVRDQQDATRAASRRTLLDRSVHRCGVQRAASLRVATESTRRCRPARATGWR